jgi:hypothetical protein
MLNKMADSLDIDREVVANLLTIDPPLDSEVNRDLFALLTGFGIDFYRAPREFGQYLRIELTKLPTITDTYDAKAAQLERITEAIAFSVKKVVDVKIVEAEAEAERVRLAKGKNPKGKGNAADEEGGSGGAVAGGVVGALVAVAVVVVVTLYIRRRNKLKQQVGGEGTEMYDKAGADTTTMSYNDINASAANGTANEKV